ncbi:hypothetical protein GTP46_19305 [Duganella sp. FT135W]|uniref:Uncharacterized protein n=1 Tax=Duganella flavida TaxID=2692175 RepID=A0A6L8KEZ6_9BURK|nr:hypothetical protein [Duganella flavida]MYM24788.1 hypothetical protein [Duganella flavida]
MKKMNLYVMMLCTLAFAACADKMNKSASNDSGYAPSGMAGPATAATQTGYGTVQAIDQLQRQDIGVGVMGAAAAGGMPGDKLYRVTVRLDDGSTQMVALESAPNYKIGDRIRYSNGTVQPY